MGRLQQGLWATALASVLGLGLAGGHVAAQRDVALGSDAQAAAQVARRSVPSQLDLWSLKTVIERAEGDGERQLLHLRVYTPWGQVPVVAALEDMGGGWRVQAAGRTDLGGSEQLQARSR